LKLFPKLQDIKWNELSKSSLTSSLLGPVWSWWLPVHTFTLSLRSVLKILWHGDWKRQPLLGNNSTSTYCGNRYMYRNGGIVGESTATLEELLKVVSSVLPVMKLCNEDG
jgi:hypothetical protein